MHRVRTGRQRAPLRSRAAFVAGGVAAAAMAVLVLSGGAREPGGESPAEGDAQSRVEDLEALATWVDGEASFSDEGRRMAHDRIAAILDRGPAEDLPGFYLQVASVVGLADNGHSNLTTAPVYGFGLVPVRAFWFSDGLHIVRAKADWSDLLGARIDSIGGVTPGELVRRLDPFHGGTDGHFRQYFATPLLFSPDFLRAAGVTESATDLRLSITAHGEPVTRTVTLQRDRNGPGRGGAGWRALVPADNAAGGAWLGVVRDSLPLFLRDSDQPFRYALIPAIDAGYIQLRSNIDRAGIAIRDFVAQVRDRLESDGPRFIILDNRFNPGGDLTRTADFARELPSLVPSDGKVYVLTSNATFSAGIYTSFYPKATDSQRTVVVGEHVGDRTRFWAESRGPVRLPNTGWTIGQSLQTHDLGTSCTTPDCHFGSRGRARFDIAVGALEPDVEIGMTFDQYRAGVDPVLGWVTEQIAR